MPVSVQCARTRRSSGSRASAHAAASAERARPKAARSGVQSSSHTAGDAAPPPPVRLRRGRLREELHRVHVQVGFGPGVQRRRPPGASGSSAAGAGPPGPRTPRRPEPLRPRGPGPRPGHPLPRCCASPTRPPDRLPRARAAATTRTGPGPTAAPPDGRAPPCAGSGPTRRSHSADRGPRSRAAARPRPPPRPRRLRRHLAVQQRRDVPRLRGRQTHHPIPFRFREPLDQHVRPVRRPVRIAHHRRQTARPHRHGADRAPARVPAPLPDLLAVERAVLQGAQPRVPPPGPGEAAPGRRQRREGLLVRVRHVTPRPGSSAAPRARRARRRSVR